MTENKFDCYKCKHRGQVPGSAHSSCKHPDIGEATPMRELFSLLGGGRGAPLGLLEEGAKNLNIKGAAHGIRNGWFNWPFNFDPVWLDNCDGFTEVKKREEV